ncbi:hypothetical protein JHL18_06040 [Clostridium sp. YIM B02505]|uniref:Polymerase/histidinol phosphatase N-terminal domain-containing protein n=1 Tax=Clostridium yunnanense TaxID=2800325 RepID=A0ABS1ELE9_9CLOT|nr:hypothetical protein [Clostridium yunnanense]MBK1810196.1 hypothetical protein [Clostridium yunnanense]
MIINPYLKAGMWLKGNLHTHTNNSKCGHYSLETVIDMYKSHKMKYDFLAITDHCMLTELKENYEDIIIFPGVEYKYRDYQTLGINIKSYSDDERNYDNHQQIFNKVDDEGGLNIICHPHVYEDNYWPVEKLLQLNGYTGLEIYNNNVKFDNKGRALATDLWDNLLSNGKKVFGFANDDMHVFQRCGCAFNMALCEEKSSTSIMEALRNGSFYGSTGIFLNKIDAVDNRLYLELKHHNIPAVFKFIGYQGKVLKETYGHEADYTLLGTEKYVRIEISREDGCMAWTQPFWLE